MPRPKLRGRDAVVGRQLRIDLRFGSAEWLAGEGVEIIEQLDERLAILLIEIKLKGVEVLESERGRGLVPQLDQFDQIGGHDAADGFAPLPNRLASIGVL